MDQLALLRALADAPASGEDLAERFGVSRAMIWKAIQALRAENLTIQAGREGYALVETAEAFGEATLSWRCGRPVTYFALCDSTNTLARQAARTPGSFPLVVADAQRAGRGRRGRDWLSPPGQNLLFSLVLRPAVPPQLAPRCVLLWAAAMARQLDVFLKWPNDLVDAQGKKLGGILAELEAEGEEVRFVVLGVGLNVNQVEFPPELPQASSLRRLRGEALDRGQLLADLVEAIEAVDVQGSLEGWRARAWGMGQRVRVGEVEGIAEGIREDGALLVSGQPILAGDVELIGS